MKSMVVRRSRARVVISLVVLAGLVLAACGGGDGSSENAEPAAKTGGSATAPRPGIRDELPDPDLTLADDVVVVRSDEGRALRAQTSDTLEIDADADGIDELDEGEVLLLTGITVARVASLKRRGDVVVVEGEPVTLPEVIVDGDLTWDSVTVDLQHARVTEWGGGAVGSGGVDEVDPEDGISEEETEELWNDVNDVLGGEEEQQSSGLVDLGDVQLIKSTTTSTTAKPGPITFKGKVPAGGGDIEYEFTYEPEGPKPNVRMQLGFGDKLKGTLDMNVTMEKLVSSGSASMTDGQVRSFETSFDELAGEVTLEANVQALANVASAVTKPLLDLPFRFEVPIVLGGIPFTFSGESTIQVNLSMAMAGSQLGGKAHFEFGGPAGVRMKNGSLSVFGERVADVTNLLESVKAAAKGPVGLVYTTELPKFGLGLGFGAVAKAKVFVSNGAVVSFHVLPMPAPCTATNVAHVMAAGVDASFLGVELELKRTPLANKQWNFQAPKDARCNAPS